MGTSIPPLANLDPQKVGDTLLRIIAGGYPMSGASTTASLARRRLDPGNWTAEEQFVHDVLTAPLETVYNEWARGGQERPDR
ncbi:hypothetical protein AB0L65_02900 [Nonomuraea sp. NPDC052116]|uniref:hypothetical protein n=1 Tax=Nonomuraea sp. NPDC052116 TaxID=3155665 RepID=UPI00344044E2